MHCGGKEGRLCPSSCSHPRNVRRISENGRIQAASTLACLRFVSAKGHCLRIGDIEGTLIL